MRQGATNSVVGKSRTWPEAIGRWLEEGLHIISLFSLLGMIDELRHDVWLPE